MAKNKSATAPSSKGKQRPPAVDKLMIPAIGIGIALLAYQFISGINNEIPRVNVDDELELRELFFGEGDGRSYAVLCHDENANIPVSSVFQDASNDGSAPAQFRLLDCGHKLESGKTVAERFNLKLKQRPTVFVSGKAGPPKQVPTKHLKTGGMLVKALKNLLEPKAVKIETTQDLRTKCLDKDVCGLLLKGSKTSPKYVKDAMNKLLVEYPKVTFAAVDTSVLYVLNLEEHLPELESGVPRFVVFKKVSGSTSKESSGRLKTSIATLPKNGVAYGAMSNLVAGVVSNKQEMTKISTLPSIKTRTKKLVEEERAKRQRRQEQKRRMDDKASSSSGPTSGQFQTNDGSREGRRAERERRRAEHRANNPNYREKTPEEIAEMERQRRQRMEEEAAKWNMAPEDAPEEGHPVYEDNGSYMMEDDDGASSLSSDGNDDEEEEDILDLD